MIAQGAGSPMGCAGLQPNRHEVAKCVRLRECTTAGDADLLFQRIQLGLHFPLCLPVDGLSFTVDLECGLPQAVTALGDTAFAGRTPSHERNPFRSGDAVMMLYDSPSGVKFVPSLV